MTEKPVAPAPTPLAAAPDIDTQGDAPMTEKQAAELRELAEKHGEAFDGNLDRAQAEERLEYLRDKD